MFYEFYFLNVWKRGALFKYNDSESNPINYWTRFTLTLCQTQPEIYNLLWNKLCGVYNQHFDVFIAGKMKICNLGFKNIVNKVLFCIYTNPNMFLDIKFLTLSWLDEVYFVLNVIKKFDNLFCFRSFSPLQWTMNIWQRFACWLNENQHLKIK